MKLSINECGLLVVEFKDNEKSGHWLLSPMELLDALKRYEPWQDDEFLANKPKQKQVVCFAADRLKFTGINPALQPSHLRVLRMLYADSPASPNQCGMAAGDYAQRLLHGETFDGPNGQPSRHQLGAIGRHTCKTLLDLELIHHIKQTIGYRGQRTYYALTDKGREYIHHVR